MVEQLYHTPDIYRIYVPLPDNPLKYLNCYVLVSNGETLIIDTGLIARNVSRHFLTDL